MTIKEITDFFKTKISSIVKTEERNTQLFLNIIIIIMINIAVASFPFRLDLTESGTYSLSPKSRELVSNLQEKLKVKVFFSEELPAEHDAVSRYLKDLLMEYSFHGNRNFSYEIIPQKDLEKEAADYGIRPVQSREFVSDQVKVRSVYMGLVIQHADLVEKIEALTTPVGLEYEISSRIEKMTSKIDRLLKLEEPVNLTLYLDPRLEKLPIDGIDKLSDYVREAADRSNRINYGKIKFNIIDPRILAKEHDPAALYGVPRLRWGATRTPSGETVKAGETPFGLVLSGNNRFRRIEINVVPTLFGTNAISGIDSLEEKINSAVGDILSVNRDVAYIVGHGIPEIREERDPDGAALFNSILSGMYNLVEVDLQLDDVPENIDVMVINGPVTEFTEEEKYKIDQFLMQGKSLLYFANSFMEINPNQQQAFMGNQPMVIPVSSGLEEMFEHYGVKINKDIVLDLNCARVNMGSMIKDYPLMPMIGREGLSRKSIITKYINSALFIKASSLESAVSADNKDVVFYDLISTSPQSWTMEGRVNFNPMTMAPPSDEMLDSRIIAAGAAGSFQSYFKEKGAPAVLNSKAGNRIRTSAVLDKTVTSGRTEIIVVGSSEIVTSGFIDHARGALAGSGSGAFSNDILFHSFVDYLSGNDYVPEMKGKSISYNPLDRTEERTRFLLKVINMGMVPFFVILTGLVVWRRRVAGKKIIEINFSGGHK